MFEDIEKVSVKERLLKYTSESMIYMLNRNDEVPENFIPFVEEFVKKTWDEIWQFYMDHGFTEEKLEKVLDMIKSPEWIRFLEFNAAFQPWIDEKMTNFAIKNNERLMKIFKENDDKETAEAQARLDKEPEAWDSGLEEEDGGLKKEDPDPIPV